MKRIALIIIVINLLVSCRHKIGSGNLISQTMEVGTFNGLDVSGPFEVEIINGPVGKVLLEADDNLMDDVRVKVINNELKIKLVEVNVSRAHLKVLITSPGITGITASASAEVIVKDMLQGTSAISIKASSAAAIKAGIDAPSINAKASSGSEITLRGRVKDLKAKVSSGSSLKAFELLSENCNIEASSGSEARINASRSVEAKASSGGTIDYSGSPASVVKHQSSGGLIEQDK